MSKIKIILFTSLIFSSFFAQAQVESIEESWIKEDSMFISKVINTVKKSPLKIDLLLTSEYNKKTDLGYDYSFVEGGSGKGYVSVFFQLIYYKSKLVSYSLSPQMPHDHRMYMRYKQIYAPLFKFDSKNKIKKYYYGYDLMAAPLPGYFYDFLGYPKNSIKSKELEYFMTPFSGIVYGKTGGEASQKLKNRALYDNIKSFLIPELYMYLLYSKNPATRLTTIEHITNYPYNNKKLQNNFNNRSISIYNALPNVWTMNGCIMTQDNAQKLVRFYSKHK